MQCDQKAALKSLLDEQRDAHVLRLDPGPFTPLADALG